MESLGDLEYHTILTKLGAEDTARVSCVNRKLRSSASDNSLWSRICSRELLLSRPLDPFSNAVPTFQKTYQTWRESFSAYPWETVKQANSCSARLRAWLLENFPESETTLRPGASEAEIDEAERKLGLEFPLSTRILYRFFDGQAFDKDYSDTLHGCPLGVIGGYSFYDRTVNVYLLPLAEIVPRTAQIRRRRSRRVVIAESSSIVSKTFLLDCNDNRLHVGTKNFRANGETIPCAPSMLSWLEEHVRRLETGEIKLRQGRKRKSPSLRSISLFPEQPPLCSEAISSTGGVKVRASAVLVPEFSDLEDEREKYFFAYSIRMSMLPRGFGSEGFGFGSCQLYWRHWRIREGERVVSDVNGEGVIGIFPVLVPGEEEFVYESCTPLPSSKGSIEGFFTFVPGRLSDQKDDPFRVEVARFPLELPEYIF